MCGGSYESGGEGPVGGLEARGKDEFKRDEMDRVADTQSRHLEEPGMFEGDS